MPRSSYADVQLEIDPGSALPALDPIDLEVDSDTPFRILVVGDFGASAAHSPIEVDRDNFDDVLESLNVTANVAGLPLRFLSMSDFHPDALHVHLPAAVAPIVKPVAREAEIPDPPTGGLEAALGGSLLDSAVDATESRTNGSAAPPSDPFTEYVRSLVQPHLTQPAVVPGLPDPNALRAVLHHPRLQQLESIWRSVHRLVHDLETGSDLQVHILHLPKVDLNADLGDAEDLRKTVLFRLLTSRRWSVIAADYYFSAEMEDLNLLGRIGMVAKQAKTAFVAGASPELMGCHSLTESPDPEDWNGEVARQGWELIRSLPEARYAGLIVPRFLVRMPYGKEGASCDEFEFEEFDHSPRHQDYLWGNGAFVAAYLLGATFSAVGWNMRPGMTLSMEGLPVHVYHEGGESAVKPCAEVFLSERAVEAMEERGLMVLTGAPGSGEVRLSGFRSIASPAAPLQGPWK